MANFEIKSGYINYRTSFITYDTSGYITSDCNSMVFINYGTNPVLIESVLLNQGQSLVIDGNQGEYTSQTFFAKFTGTGSNNLVTVKKNYI